MMGTTRITRNIFAGNQDKSENAKAFLDNLNKIKLAKERIPLGKESFHLRSRIDGDVMSQASYPTILDDEHVSVMSENVGFNREQRDAYHSDSGYESLDPVCEEVEDDEVLLNISPNKFEKPKD